MPLTDFEIIHSRPGSEDPEIACRDGRQRVLAQVTEEAWDDALRLPPGETLRTIPEHNILSQQHLPVLQEMIQARYDAGAFEILSRTGGNYPLVVLRSADMERVRSRLSRAPLDMHRQARFV